MQLKIASWQLPYQHTAQDSKHIPLLYSVSFTQWEPGHPNGDAEDCVMFYDEDWYNLQCSLSSNYICEASECALLL